MKKHEKTWETAVMTTTDKKHTCTDASEVIAKVLY